MKSGYKFGRLITIVSLAVVLIGQTAWAAGEKLYYDLSTPSYTVHSTNPDGSGDTVLIADDGVSGWGNIAADGVNGKVYLLHYQNPNYFIYRMNADGSGGSDIISLGPTNIGGLAVDDAAGKIYYSLSTPSYTVHSANLDGSGDTVLIADDGVSGWGDIAADGVNGKVYLLRYQNPNYFIYRMNADGSGGSDIISLGPTNIGGLAVDGAAGKIYYSLSTPSYTVHSANLDGSGDTVLIAKDGVSGWGEITVDSANGKVYLKHYINPTYYIYWMNADGSSGSNIINLGTTNIGGLGFPTAFSLADTDGTLTAADGVAESVNIPTTVTSGAPVNVFDFTISDGGTSDGLPLEVSQINLNLSGTASAIFSKLRFGLSGCASKADIAPSGSTVSFTATGITVADGGSTTCTVSAYWNDDTGITDNQTLVLTLDGDTGLTVGASGTQMSGSNSAVATGNMLTTVTATRLVFTTQPGSSISGAALTTQPVVKAVDAAGNTDTDFTETITLTEDSAGSLSNSAQPATAGVATFTNLTYSATADQQSFILTANDEDGMGTNLPTVDANSLTSDVVATKLLFTTEPSPTNVDSGQAAAFTIVPVVSAVDADNLVDTGYSTDIVLAGDGPGTATLSGTGDTDGSAATVTLTPSSGVATFAGLSVTYTASGGRNETFTLQATSGGLTFADSNIITAKVNTAPALGGSFTTAGTVNDDSTISPFSGVTVADVDGDTVSVSITYPAANGTLSGNGVTGSAGSYTVIAAAPATATSNLEGIIFTPTANQVAPGATVVTTFTLTPNDGRVDGASNATTQVTATSINDAPDNTAIPAIIGTAQVARLLTSDTGTWNDPDVGASLSYSYQWYRADDSSGTNSTAITGAMTDSYTLTPADAHKYVQVVVTANDAQGSSDQTAGSAWTAVAVNHAPTITNDTNLGGFLPVGATGLSGGAIYSPSLALNPADIPYLAYRDVLNGETAVVKMFDGSDWVDVGMPQGVSNGSVDGLALAVDADGTPYLAYIDSSDGSNAIVVKAFGSNGWQPVGASDTGAYASTSGTGNLSLAFDAAGQPWIAFVDASGDRASVIRFDGDTWMTVGQPGFSLGQVVHVRLALFQDSGGTTKAFVAYGDIAMGFRGTVQEFDGSDWAPVGPAGFTQGFAWSPSLAIDSNGLPYLAYRDGGNANRLTLEHFDGSAWEPVGSAGFTAGLAYDPSLALAGDDTPYVACRDDAAGNGASVHAFRSNAWGAVGNAGFSEGTVTSPSLALNGVDFPFVAYSDNAREAGATVMRYAKTLEFTVIEPSNPVAGQGVDVGNLTAADPDLDELTFSLIGGADKDVFAIDSTSGALTFKTAPFYASPTDSNGDNVYELLVQVSDGQAMDVAVVKVSILPNVNKPGFDTNPVTTATQGAAYSYTAAASDPNGDVLTWGAPVLPSWLNFDTGTHTLSGTPGNDSVGVNAVTLQVDDGSNVVQQSFTITVANVNDAPTITSTALTAATQDVAYSYTLTASDIDPGPDTLTYSAPVLPAWLSFDADTHILSGTPVNGEVGDHAVTLQVDDGTAQVQQSFTITVANVNDAPTITSQAVSAATQDVAYSYTLTASDIDPGPDTLTYSAPVLPPWLNFDANTQILTGTPGNAEVGDHAVTLQVSDGSVEVQQSFTITVANVNDPPTISGTPVTTAPPEVQYSFTPTAVDPDGDTLTFSIQNAPAGCSFDPATGQLIWTPTPAQAGLTFGNIIIAVTDSLSDPVPLPAFALAVQAHFATPTATAYRSQYQGALKIEGVDAQVGDEVAAFDPDGVLCGRFVVTSPGQYGVMDIYGDDPDTTSVDEGVVAGDRLTFKVWDNVGGRELAGQTTVQDGGPDPVVWADDYGTTVHQVDIDGIFEISVNYDLQPGWNLVSFPLGVDWYTSAAPPAMEMPTGTHHRSVAALGDLLTTIDGQYESVFAFQNSSWTFYNPAYPAFSTLTNLTGGYGYWIKMTQAGTLTLSGPPLNTAATLQLASGWNLVGYWGADAMNMPGALGALSSSANFTSIFGFDPVDGWQFYNQALGFGTLPVLNQGKGYWIQLTAPDLIDGNAGAPPPGGGPDPNAGGGVPSI